MWAAGARRCWPNSTAPGCRMACSTSSMCRISRRQSPRWRCRVRATIPCLNCRWMASLTIAMIRQTSSSSSRWKSVQLPRLPSSIRASPSPWTSRISPFVPCCSWSPISTISTWWRPIRSGATLLCGWMACPGSRPSTSFWKCGGWTSGWITTSCWWLLPTR